MMEQYLVALPFNNWLHIEQKDESKRKCLSKSES